MARSDGRSQYTDGVRHLVAVGLLLAIWLAPPPGSAQGPPLDPAADTAAATVESPSTRGLPLFLTVGIGYGQRFDSRSQCSNPQNIQSFTGHVSIGKYLTRELGIGVDASVWRRGHPGAPGAPDSLGVPTPTTLVNQLGNVSLSLSLEAWHIFVRAGVGIALGRQDLQDAGGLVTSATGLGLGYSVGGGATLPLASLVSLAIFANWNAGRYDLITPSEVLDRGATHRYVELGFGLTLR